MKNERAGLEAGLRAQKVRAGVGMAPSCVPWPRPATGGMERGNF